MKTITGVFIILFICLPFVISCKTEIKKADSSNKSTESPVTANHLIAKDSVLRTIQKSILTKQEPRCILDTNTSHGLMLQETCLDYPILKR